MHKIILAVLALISGSSAANADPAKCILEIDGKNVINGKCDFSPIGKDGSFIITSNDGSTFAQVSVEEKDNGIIYWNGGNFTSHAHGTVGRAMRFGACWIVDSANRVCASK